MVKSPIKYDLEAKPLRLIIFLNRKRKLEIGGGKLIHRRCS